MGKRRRTAPALQNESIIPPTLERAAQARAAGLAIEAAEAERTASGGGRAFTDSEGRPSRPWRVVDTLTAMERAGSITGEERQAGERFRALFEISGRAGASATRIEPRSAGGDQASAIERRVAAGRALAEAARILHAPGPLHSIVIEVVGLGMSCSAWDRAHKCREGRASAMVSEALAILSREW